MNEDEGRRVLSHPASCVRIKVVSSMSALEILQIAADDVGVKYSYCLCWNSS